MQGWQLRRRGPRKVQQRDLGRVSAGSVGGHVRAESVGRAWDWGEPASPHRAVRGAWDVTEGTRLPQGNLEEASPLTFGAQQQGPCQEADAEAVREMRSSPKLQSHAV